MIKSKIRVSLVIPAYNEESYLRLCLEAAAAFTKNLIGAQQVRLASDPESTNRDRYNRLLRYVYIPDGRMVETELIKGGYGFAYTSFPFTKSTDFTQDQTAAQAAAKGLWGNCKPFQETNGRWQTENAS